LALERGRVGRIVATAEEHLLMRRLDGLDRFADVAVGGGNLAPADDGLAALLRAPDEYGAHGLACRRVGRQEQLADAVVAGGGQIKAQPRRLLHEELVRDLRQDTRAVAGVMLRA